jgi:hypothetical protein
MVTFNNSLSPSGVHYAWLGDQKVAQYVEGPAGASLRWIHLNYPTSGYIEIHSSEAEAKAAVESWLSGLDIVPWDAAGRPEA